MHSHAPSSNHADAARPRTRRHAIGQLMVASASLVLAGCGALKPSAEPTPAYYTLESAERGSAPPANASPTSSEAPSLLVLPTRSTPGYDSQRIIYLREPHRLEYFARSEWVDPPARMLGPLMVQRLQRGGAFGAVVLAPSASRAALQLETQVLRLQHEFLQQPSQVRFGLRATVSDSRTRAVLGTRDFEAVVAATEDTPYGGVRAAHQAVQQVLDQLDAFCRGVPVPPPRDPAASGTRR